jgi:hypothetical protein
MDNIEQLIDDAIIAAAMAVEPIVAEPMRIDGMGQLVGSQEVGLDEHHVAEPVHQTPPGAFEIPYVAPGLLTHVCKHDAQASTWVAMPTTVEKASYRCKNPQQREWIDVLRAIDGMFLHVSCRCVSCYWESMYRNIRPHTHTRSNHCTQARYVGDITGTDWYDNDPCAKYLKGSCGHNCHR